MRRRAISSPRLLSRPCDLLNPIILASAWRVGPVGLDVVGPPFLFSRTSGRQECLPNRLIVTKKRLVPPSQRCKSTAFFCLRHLAGYHPISSFAVQLSSQQPN